MPKKPQKTIEDDAALLAIAFKDVTPLKGRKISKAAGKSKPPPKAKPPPKPPAPKSIAIPKQKPKPTQPDLAHGDAPGVDKRTAQRLKRGRLDVEARLDLHGDTQDTAHRALAAFLDGAQNSGKRCVLVVTGKGGTVTDSETGRARQTGILKEMVPRWLNQSPNRERVLSFTFAAAADGGSGALYILLKKRAGR
ncbi:MAG: Smr/MutS family protein [Rhodospirillales bacterium]|nr:Smr/MutS family protein [Rhodospirillales bacterium]